MSGFDRVMERRWHDRASPTILNGSGGQRLRATDFSPEEAAVALGGRVANSGWIDCPGPGHSAGDVSLGVRLDDDDPEGFKTNSKSGDDWKECRAHVRECLGLPEPKTDRWPEFIYEDADGQPYLKKVKKPLKDGKKTFFQQHWTGHDWETDKPFGPAVPYRLPELLGADPEAVVYVTEGEKDADNVAALGLIATTNSDGAGKWPPELSPYLLGRKVRILTDNDKAGRDHARLVATALHGVAADVRIVELPDLPPKGDVTDWIDADPDKHDADALAVICEAVPVFRPNIIEATAFLPVEPQNIAPRQWLYGGHFIRKFVTATMAPSGVGKSSFSMVEAMAMATGRDLLSVGFKPPLAGLRVWYWNGEDPFEELQRRVAAIMLHYQVSPDALGGRLFLNSGRDCPIIVASEANYELTVNDKGLEQLEATIRANGIDALILDPFVSVHAVSENDNNKIGHVVKTLADIADRTNCAIELVHHVRKTAFGAEVTVDDGRGAGAFKDRVRSARVLNPMSGSEAGKFGIDEDRRRFYARVDNGKSNLAPPAKAMWMQMVGVGLGNALPDYPADEVGVTARWEPPDVSAGATEEQVELAQANIRAGEWRKDQQAASWVGYAIGQALGIDVSAESPGRKRVNALIKLWVKEGLLVEVQRRDPVTRKDKPFMEAGKCPSF